MTTRQQIRAHLAQALAALPSVFTTTFDHRPARIFETELPCASVYFEDGESDRDLDTDAWTTGRLAVDVTATLDGNIDGLLDEKAAAVEQYLRDNRELGGLVDFVARDGFTYERDPERFDGTLTLFLTVKYDDED